MLAMLLRRPLHDLSLRGWVVAQPSLCQSFASETDRAGAGPGRGQVAGDFARNMRRCKAGTSTEAESCR
jgi:hypothetical protein